ncbi:Phosphatidylserine decarboxylase [Corallococcus soli]
MRSVAVWLWQVWPAVAWAKDVTAPAAKERAPTRAWHFLTRLEALGTGGTRLFPTEEGTLRPGAFASVGLGVDHAH